jgi:hypothetical protein
MANEGISVRALQRPDPDLGHLGRSRQGEGGRDHYSNVFRLEKKFRPVGAALLLEKRGHERGCRAAGEYAEDADSITVNLIAKAVRHGPESVVHRGILTRHCGRAKAGGGIDKHNLSAPFTQGGEKGLNQRIVSAQIGAIQQVELIEGRGFEAAVEEGPSAKHQHVGASEFVLDRLSQRLNFGIAGQIGAINVGASSTGAYFAAHSLQCGSAAGSQADLRALRRQLQGNSPANTAAGPGYNGDPAS